MERETKSSRVDNNLPPVPLTLDGSYILHQMFRVRWSSWRALGASDQRGILERVIARYKTFEESRDQPSALFSLLGHKGDLMILHFRKTLDELNDAELRVEHSRLHEFLEPTTSYVSVVELGLYEASVKLYQDLNAKGIQAGSADWNKEIDNELAKQRETAAPRLWPEIPQRRYLCFYPMNKLRGEAKNWYKEPITQRQQMMREHGLIGRQYAGQVIQIISGSIGLDDWEWGVDLFADNPLVFKKLVYEMRFDDASAVYGLFGSFFVGLRFPARHLGSLFEGKTPSFA